MNMSAKMRLSAATGDGAHSAAHAPLSAAASTSTNSPSMRVSVVVRVRPLLQRERQQTPVVTVTPGKTHSLSSTLTLTSPGHNAEAVQFQMDKCYDERTSQHVLFEKEVAPAVARIITGVNTTVFAYGATGTGKTFTMEGSKTDLGVIPRCVKRLFEAAKESTNQVQVHLSYLEIYNDRVQDLLTPSEYPADLPIRQQPNGAIVIQGLSRWRIASLAEFELLYGKGSTSRKKAATELNPESSRSHSILMVHVRSVEPSSGETRDGKLHLIDLAGSEDNRRTGNSGARLAESGKINTSLFVLGKVLMALNTGESKRIPFRDSKLTRLLQDSLGGSSHAVMICNVAPTVEMYADTLQTLNYALKAKGIVNKVVINRSLPPPPPPPPSGQATPTRMPLSPASNNRTTEQPAKMARAEKLQQWKQAKAKANARSASLEQRDAGSVGGGKRRSLAVGCMPSGRSSPSSASNKRLRLSTALSPVPMTANRPPQSSSSGKLPPTRQPTADGKENAPEPTRDVFDDGDPAGLAKKLIGLAIGLERKQRLASAYCVFKRAAHVLPHANAELAQWLRQLTAQIPAVEAATPDQYMTTAKYMEIVLERDLLHVLNGGSKAELMQMNAIGAKRADKIVDSRPFHQLQDVLRVPSISPKVLASMCAQHLTLG